MELRHLKYFVAVAEERHFKKASARLRVAQPAVSKQIKDLENELGVPLLTRDKFKTVELTIAGKNFLAFARDILKQAAESLRKMKFFCNQGNKKLTIGLAEAIMVGTYIPAIINYNKTHPDVELDVLELTPQAQIESLRSGHIDLGFPGIESEEIKKEKDMDTTIVRSFNMAIALSDTHTFARRRSIKLSEFAGENFIGFSEKTHPGRLSALYRLCQKAGFTPSVPYLADSLSAVLALIGRSKGVCPVAQEFSQLSYPNVVFVPISHPSPEGNAIVIYRKSEENQMVTDLINTVHKQFKWIFFICINTEN